MNYLIEISVEQESLWWICGVLYFLIAILSMRMFARVFKIKENAWVTNDQRLEEAMVCGIMGGLIWPGTILLLLILTLAYLIGTCLIWFFKHVVFRGFK